MNKERFSSVEVCLAKLRVKMKLRNFSQRIIKSYFQYIMRCLRFARKSPRDINGDDVRNFLAHLADNGCGGSTLNTAYSALKFYFSVFLNRKFFASIPRAKKERKLPTVLCREDVMNMINSAKKVKHKCMISLLYGTGMRVGELVRLRMRDFDFSRKIIIIRHGHLRERSVELIIKVTGLKAGLRRLVTSHVLRHSFATHLLESGVDIMYIQKLLGHSRVVTTEIYTHVDKGKLLSIPSPLDA